MPKGRRCGCRRIAQSMYYGNINLGMIAAGASTKDDREIILFS
jgi:hypothetical protein